MTLTVDPNRTAERRRALDAYFSTNVLGADFVCPHYGQCKSSHPGLFYEGQLHHVGRYYDLAFDSLPLRTMIVGQEYGHPPSRVGMNARYEMIMKSGLELRFKAQSGHKPRNPHMRGTTNVLRLLFGVPLGADHDSEFLSAAGQRIHLFDAFSLVDYLLCSAVGLDGLMRGLATRTMLKNCRGHFREVVRMLEPSVIVMQGKGFWKTVQSAFDSVAESTDHLFSVTLGPLKVLVAVFTHPSAPFPNNWGANHQTPYLLGTVAPTIASVRGHLLSNSNR